MKGLVRAAKRLAGVFSGARHESELAEELEAHLEMQTDDNRRLGMSPQEARRAALLKFGGVERMKESYREQRGLPLVETLAQDLRYALRALRKSPGFTLVAVMSLALGIGANTAMFSVVHAVLLRSLPYPEPDRLVRVVRKATQDAVSMAEYRFWKEHTSSFFAVAGDRGVFDRSFVADGRTEWIRVLPVTADFFRALGIAPALGREFDAQETSPRGPKAIILSDRLWRSAFGADPNILSQVVAMDDGAYVVVGVTPAQLWFPQAAEAYVPFQSDLGTNTSMVARLKPGVSLREAGAEMANLTESFRRANAASASNNYQGLSVMPYAEWLVGDVRTKLFLLSGAVGLLLLIACSNLASLLLARLRAREKEIAVRLALGGSPGRVMGQFLIENLLLSLLGGLAGLLGTYALLDGFVALIPFHLPASEPIAIDWSVLAFTLSIALGTALAFSLAPFLTSSRINVQETLKSAGRPVGAIRQRARSFLVVVEVAVSVTLLVAAALLIQSLYRMHQERLGFTPRGLVTFWTPPFPGRQSQSAAARQHFETTLLERLRTTPGILSVSAINALPLTGQNNFPAQREGHPEQSIGGMEIREVTPGYFETMGIPVLRGRAFTEGDARATPPVILVNETLARRWWPKGSPLADRVVIGRYQGQNLGEDSPREIVGVVADTKTVYLKAPPRPTVYVPTAQASWYTGGMAWVVRAERVTALPDLLRRTVAEIDPRQSVQRLKTMDEIVAATTSESRFDAWLYGTFAGLALALTSIGIYGLLSFSVARRTSEIGVRMALGASRSNVLLLVLRQGLALIAIGLLSGLAGAAAVTRSLSTLLYGVRPTDPLSFLAVAALCLAVGALASYLPARRASRVDPIVALRFE